MKNKKTIRTNWDPRFDGKPDDSSPRIKFTHKFGDKYVEKSKRILDVGCGIGSYLYTIDRKDCFGIDLEFQALKIAKKYCMKSDLTVASVLHLPFRNEAFDLIVMWEIIEHLSNGTEMQAMTEVYRTLSAQGRLLLSTPNRHIVSNILDPAFILFGHRHYDVRKLVKFIAGIGFIVNNYTVRGRLATLICLNIFYFCKHILHKKVRTLQKFFDQKSEKEFNSKEEGIANIFLEAEKIQ